MLYKNASLSKWLAPQDCHNKVLDWLTNEKPFLLVQGGPGTGKTFLSASILNYWQEHGKERFYTSHRRFMSSIQSDFDKNTDQYQAVKSIAYKKNFIFDDLGSSTNTSWQIDMLLELFDIRYSNKLKTLITTNLSNDDLYEILDDRLASRILDKSNQFIEFWSEDKRTNGNT